MRRFIPQAEAHRLLKKVDELQERDQRRHAHWVKDYPEGVHVETVSLNSSEKASIGTALKLGYVIVAKIGNNNEMLLYAVKP